MNSNKLPVFASPFWSTSLHCFLVAGFFSRKDALVVWNSEEMPISSISKFLDKTISSHCTESDGYTRIVQDTKTYAYRMPKCIPLVR